jgi:hypothetical protein
MKTLRKYAPILILLSLPLVPCSLACAQDSSSSEQIPPPSAPYVATLSGNFNLTKKFNYLSNPDVHLTDAQKAAQDFLAPPASKLVEVNVVSNGTIRRDTNHFLTGSTRDIWQIRRYQITVYSNFPNDVSVSLVNPQSNPPDQGSPDFPELSWIKGSSYQGVQMQQGKKCYAYKDGDRTAWIDVSSRFPVYFESKTQQVTYTFSDPPDDLQLPTGYLEKIQKYQRALRGQT